MEATAPTSPAAGAQPTPTVESLTTDLRQLELRLHRSLLESTIDFSAQFVDPTEALFDDGDFVYPVGAWEQVPWTYDSRKKGEVLPVYLTEQGLKIIRDLSRQQCRRNPFAINATTNRVSYSVGLGMIPKVTPIHAGVPDRLVMLTQEVIDEFVQYSNWHGTQQEIVRRYDRDGDTFLRWFPQLDGTTACRFIEPEHVKAPEGRTDKQFSFGLETTPWDVCNVQAYWVVSDPDKGIADERVPANEVQHFKANVDSTSKRGVPTMYPVRENLDRTSKLLRNMSLMAQIQATFALIRKYKGYNPNAIEAANTNDTDFTFTGQTRVKNIRQYQPGSVVDAPDGVEYEFPGGTVNAASFVAILQAEIRAIAAMLVMPEFMISSDASNANYASTMVAESPAVKNFEGLQAYFKRNFGDGKYTPKETKNIPSLWRVVRNAVRVGRLPREALRLVKIQLEAPTLVVRDRLQEAQRKQILKMNRVMSGQTWAMQEDLDWDQEQQNLQDEADAMPSAPSPLPLPPGQGGNDGDLHPGLSTNPNPFQARESLREGKDANGMNHKSDGKFGTGAGGTSKKKSSSAGPSTKNSLPSDHDLAGAKVEPVKSAGAVHGEGGLSKVTVGDKSYFFKAASASESAREEVTAHLAGIAGVGVPSSRIATVGGKAGVLSSWSDGVPADKDKAGFLAAVKADPAQATKLAAFNFLVGAEDRHSGNYLLKDGQITSIDHSDSVLPNRTPADAAELMGQDDLLAAMEKAQGDGDIRFDAASVGDVASKTQEMADHLRSKGMDAAAKSLEARGAVLQKLAADKNPTEGRLKELAGL
jgi:hypothetical protein